MIILLELFVELHHLAYPATLLKALAHSLPASPATLAARRCIRKWLSAPMGMVDVDNGHDVALEMRSTSLRPHASLRPSMLYNIQSSS